MRDHRVHKYQRIRLGGKDYFVFRCVLRGCNHYLPEELVIGKENICWKCETVHVVKKTRKGKVAFKPICEDCRLDRKRVKSTEVDMTELIKKVLNP